MDEGLRERLLRRVDLRTVFVVGKGGVGKSTTAASLALEWARGGQPTYLISTDPAHSLADILELPAGDDGVREEVCDEALTVEEFDAGAYADDWIGKATGPATELFELGTYLDEDDIRRFLDLSLPGLDEVMAALRLNELLDGPAERIVVDTAPTGHALRLLDSGEVLGSWVHALRAMARKATVVAEHLTRREVRLGAEEFVDELEEGVRRFRDRVLDEACFVVVDRPGRVVAVETERLLRSLEERGLEVCARVRVGREAEHGNPDLVSVPPRSDLRGCEGLARWGEPGDGDVAREEAGAAPTMEMPAGAFDDGGPPGTLRGLLERRLILVAGKGGVGKSTCAAACAAEAAEAAPTVLVSTDPAGSLEALFGVEIPAGGEVAVTETLGLRQLDAEAEFERFLERYRTQVERIAEGLGMGREAALDREVMEALLELAPPGIDEIFALTVVMDVTEEHRRVVVDTAPTGHFLRLVRMPEAALEWTRTLMRVLLKYRSVAGLDETAERLLTLARRLKALRALLTDPERATTLLVTLDEPVVAAESRDLLDAVERAGLPMGAWIHNRMSPGQRLRHPTAEGPDGAPALAAPELDVGPTGIDALREFLSRWTELEARP